MPTSTGKIYLGSNLLSGGSSAVVAPTSTPWVRNPSWPACEANAGDNKVTGLFAVWPGDGVGAGGNFFAMIIGGAYDIDFGDGTTSNSTTLGNTPYHEYDYNNINLAGTDAPVTFTASTSTINRTAHGYSNGMVVKFYNIVTTTGLTMSQQYYVINATANTFQVSAAEGGSAVTLTNDGSATLLPYKTAVLTISPQAGSNLTSLDFQIRWKGTETGYQSRWASNWLDIAIALPNCTSLSFNRFPNAGGNKMIPTYLESVKLNQLGNITSFYYLFYQFSSLRYVSIADTNTTVTNMSGMFYDCWSLTTVSLGNTALVTNMSYMFTNCYALTSVSLFDTSSATTLEKMFQRCYALTSVPLFNTSLVTNVLYMFGECFSLTTVPLFNTSLVTNMSNMFSACRSLTSVPLFNTSSVTNMSSMFNTCYELTSVPLFNTSSVTNMSSMFYQCYALTSVPLFDTSSATNMAGFLYSCRKVINIPALDLGSATNLSGYPFYIGGGGRLEAINIISSFSMPGMNMTAVALNEVYTNLATVVGQTIEVIDNLGTTNDDPSIATAKGWTVIGS
jgi:surface protein